MSSRIMVVDDEKHIVELARLYLTREGYEVEGVGDGSQAVARFGQLLMARLALMRQTGNCEPRGKSFLATCR